MKHNLKILHLEDLASDAELVAMELKKGGFLFELQLVDNKLDFIKALKEFKPDIVLSDHSLPSFNSIEALEILKTSALDIPFILITSTISEEFAVQIMLNGASDYILKDRLQRLPKAVENAYNKWQAEYDKQKYFDTIIANEKLLKESQRIAHLGSWEYNYITNETTWSNETYKIFGLLPGAIEPSLENFYNFIHPDDLAFVKEKVSETQQTNVDVTFNNRIIRKDKEIRYISSRNTQEFDNNNRLIKLQGILQDITERRLTEMEREFDSNNLKALINNTDNLMWSIGTDFKIITWNKAFEDTMMQVTGRALIKGEPLPNIGFSDEQIKNWNKYYERAFSGEKFTLIEQAEAPKEIWTEISFYPIYSHNKVIGTACFSRNITERKIFEREMQKTTAELFAIKEKLEHNEQRLKQAQSIAHLGNWELNFKNGLVTLSDEACKILGLTPSENQLRIDEWKSYLHEDDLEMVENTIENSRLSLQDFSFFHRIVRRNGEVRHLHFESRYEFDEHNNPTSLFGVILDITERKKQEEDLRNLLKVTTDQNFRLQNFAYIVSHNIRSHSANISGLLDFIANSESEAETMRLMNMLNFTANKLAETIENLNEIITIQNDVKLQKAKVNLKEEIIKTSYVINGLIEETGTVIDVDISEQLYLEVVPSYLESILINIISNAIKYRSPNRKAIVRITHRTEGDYHVVSIADNGIGIDLEKNADKVFGMYKTFHNNKDARGFGLYITKNQIEVMGGKIEIESSIDEGTTFNIYFRK